MNKQEYLDHNFPCLQLDTNIYLYINNNHIYNNGCNVLETMSRG